MEFSGSYIDWLANLKGFNSNQMMLEPLCFTAVTAATNASSDVHARDRAEFERGKNARRACLIGGRR
jgi:hypothetical protein